MVLVNLEGLIKVSSQHRAYQIRMLVRYHLTDKILSPVSYQVYLRFQPIKHQLSEYFVFRDEALICQEDLLRLYGILV